MTQGQDLLTGSVPKKLIRFAFPLFLANLLQALYNVVDMLVVGKSWERLDWPPSATPPCCALSSIPFALA